jgi:hypothetical protein
MRTFSLVITVCLSAVCIAAPLFNSFNSGELSPLIKYRVDIQQRQSGVETLENMLVKVPGAAARRPGTEYIAGTKNNGRARLVPFEYSTEDAYILEFGDKYIRFFRDGGQILSGIGIENYAGLDCEGDLLAHWNLNDDDDSNRVTELNEIYNGVIVDSNSEDIHWFGKVGAGCFDFGQTDAVLIPDNAVWTFDENDDPFTVAAWIYVTDTDEVQTILSKWDASIGREWRFQLLPNETIRLELYDNSLDIIGNCISQWKLNDDTNNATVVDSRGEQDGTVGVNTSVLANPAGKINGCFDFDNAYAVTVDDNAVYSFGNSSTDVAFSIGLWAKISGSGGEIFISKWDSANKREWSLYTEYISPTTFSINTQLYDESVDKYIFQTTNALSNNTNWHFVVMTYSGNESYTGIKIYVDGINSTGSSGYKQTGYIAMENLAAKVAIGAYYTSGVLSYFYDLVIDNVMIFNKELSLAEVASLYVFGSGTESLIGDSVYATSNEPLEGSWHFVVAGYDSTGGATAANGITLYVDGNDVNSTAHNYTSYVAMENTASTVLIGAQKSTSGNLQYIYADKIDNVAIFQDVLDANEIADLYTIGEYEIISPYTVSMLRNIHYVQINDIIYFVHPDIPPQKLTRYNHDLWTIEQIDWLWGPFLEDNITDITITPSGTTGTVTLTASKKLFKPDQVGALWKITEKQDTTYIKETISSNKSTSSLQIQGDYLLKLVSTGLNALIVLEKSEDDGTTWIPVYQRPGIDTTTDFDVEYAGNEVERGWIYQITTTDRTAGSVKVTLTANENYLDGYVRITDYISSTVVQTLVIEDLAGTSTTKRWAEGSWSDYRGWPRAIELYQNRLVLAGTKYQPNGIWFSSSLDGENMEVTGLDSGAIDYEVGSAKQNPILWLQSKNGVIAGTSGSIIRIFSQSSNSTLTLSSIGSETQNQAGSCDMQAQLINDSIVFVDRNHRKIRDIVYDLQSDSFVSPELTVLAEHITDPCIVEVAVQNRPEPILWYIRGDGEMVSLTYNKEQAVTGWARHITEGGEFESDAVIPSATEDELWVIVDRTIDTNEVRYIERFKPQDWGTDPNNCWFVDSGLSYSGISTHTLTGLGHLEGEEVQIFYDGNSFETKDVNGGEVILDVNVTGAIVGLGYASTLQTFPVELNMQNGPTVGHSKKIYEIVGCFYRSMFGEYGYVGQWSIPTMYAIPFSVWPDSSIGSDAPFTGQIRLPIDGGWDDEGRIKFYQNEPYPMNITALVTKIEVSEN